MINTKKTLPGITIFSCPDCKRTPKTERDRLSGFCSYCGYSSTLGHSILKNWYFLKRRKPVPMTNMKQMYHYNETKSGCYRKRIRTTHLTDNLWVSTIFLGLDHAIYGDEPKLFETMVFDSSWDGEWQSRCSNHRQALAMHKAGIAYAKKIKKTKSFIW